VYLKACIESKCDLLHNHKQDQPTVSCSAHNTSNSAQPHRPPGSRDDQGAANTPQCGTVPQVDFMCMLLALMIRLLARGLNLDEGCGGWGAIYRPLKGPTCKRHPTRSLVAQTARQSVNQWYSRSPLCRQVQPLDVPSKSGQQSKAWLRRGATNMKICTS
jgi:hypothetical protein